MAVKNIPQILDGERETRKTYSQLQELVSSINRKVAVLESKWQSPAARDFQEIMARWRTVADRLLREMADVADNLQRAAEIHQANESNATQAMKSAVADIPTGSRIGSALGG